jgi:hypothetical protein
MARQRKPDGKSGPTRIVEALKLADEARTTLAFDNIHLRIYDDGATWRFYADDVQIAKFRPAHQELQLLTLHATRMQQEHCASVVAATRRARARVRHRRALPAAPGGQ